MAGHTAAAAQAPALSTAPPATITSFAAGPAASTSTRVPAARRACGFVGGETYRHCATRGRVLIDAENIWGTTYRNICVKPGDTHLGYLSYWVIAYAWYIGRTC
ncbi:DUF6355 family natural product biosynthesis protein [Solirubrobacter deserti]|uniref:DUF6355 family natural product biosynthesis protein n=1 Tax=Solirubrobacter deserti TaxID=2282478 RepID=A0ABT4REE5_9ACTN|nr:DUF6355 family natural product biosynthesis protein [Solirubrobacter deserti]MDA0136898.1 DUF6355 family natural product biosynthesis protein [Solirubrobacter deserti]